MMINVIVIISHTLCIAEYWLGSKKAKYYGHSHKSFKNGTAYPVTCPNLLTAHQGWGKQINICKNNPRGFSDKKFADFLTFCKCETSLCFLLSERRKITWIFIWKIVTIWHTVCPRRLSNLHSLVLSNMDKTSWTHSIW